MDADARLDVVTVSVTNLHGDAIFGPAELLREGLIERLQQELLEKRPRQLVQLFQGEMQLSEFSAVHDDVLQLSATFSPVVSEDDRQRCLHKIRSADGVRVAVHLCQFPKAVRDDPEIMLAAVTRDPWTLELGTPDIRSSRDIVMRAVELNGRALQHASEQLLGDREVVLKAVAADGWALQLAHERLRGDMDVVLNAISTNAWAIRHASDALRNNRDVVTEAVMRVGFTLEWASAELQDDIDVVLKAVRQDGRALRHASNRLKGNRHVVLTAVERDGRALEYASDFLRDDMQIVLKASEQNAEVLCFASDSLRGERVAKGEFLRFCFLKLANEGGRCGKFLARTISHAHRGNQL